MGDSQDPVTELARQAESARKNALPMMAYVLASSFYLGLDTVQVSTAAVVVYVLISVCLRPSWGTVFWATLLIGVSTGVLLLVRNFLFGVDDYWSTLPLGFGIGMLVSTGVVAFRGLSLYQFYAMLGLARCPVVVHGAAGSAYRSMEITLPLLRRTITTLRLRGLVGRPKKALSLLLENSLIGFLEFQADYSLQWELAPPQRVEVRRSEWLNIRSLLFSLYTSCIAMGAWYG